MRRPLKAGDKVRAILNPDTVYRVEKARNGWLTVRVTDDWINSDLVYERQRSNLFELV